MMLRVFVVLLLATVASAFRPTNRMGVRSMTMKIEVPKIAVPAALMPMVVPATAFAAEGTGRVSEYKYKH